MVERDPGAVWDDGKLKVYACIAKTEGASVCHNA